MEWIDIKDQLPTEEGKYVVKTKTQMGNTHKVECNCYINKDKGKTKVTFSVTNQIVTHWLNEREC